MPKGNLAPGARLSDLLRAPAGRIDLGAVETRATPGFTGGGKEDAEADRPELAERLSTLQEQLYAEGRTGGTRNVLLVLQGMDTSGKGGTIRHVVGQVDPAGVHVAQFGRPTAEERQHDFLWRIRKRLPDHGRIGTFDRSHYEDVVTTLVQRQIDDETRDRRIAQILRFEEDLAATGTVLVKCFLHISRDEQKERLLARLDDPAKHWKYDPGDRETRARWDDYMAAYAYALERTGTEIAPWHIVPADRKWYRNWAITHILSEHLEAMDLRWPEARFDVAAERAALLAMP